ncbi:hypothetical protein Tco_0997641 [Tanacetum coccineum]
MDNSFTLGSTEEADNVKILQSCNGLLLCSETENRQFTLYKLNIEHHDDLIIKTIEIAYGLHRGRNFLQSFGCSDDPMLVLIDIPGMLHLEGRLFESCRCLLLDLVNTDEFMTPLLERWSIRFTVWSISLGERGEDSFSVINLSGKVVKYNLISKTISKIFDIRSNQMDDDDDYGKKILFSLFECDFVSLDSRLDSRKSTMDNSFGSAEKVDHVRILQSCNGLLLCAETGNWILWRDQFNYLGYDHFDSVIYWNDAFHWLETENRQLKHYKLNIEDHDHPIITTIETPHRLHRGRNFLESFGGSSDDPILMLIEIPQMLHLEEKFVESCGCLILVCRDDIGSREFIIYDMMKGCSV